MALELLGGLVAKELHAVPALDERLPLCREAFKFDRADFRAVLFLLAAPLRLLIVVEFAFDPARGAMEDVDGRPEQVFEVGFETGVDQRYDEGVEDVGDSASDDLALRAGALDQVRPGRGDSRRAGVLRGRDRSGMRHAAARGRCLRGRSSSVLPFVGSAAPIAAFVATKGGGRTGPAPRSEAEAAEAERRMAGAGYFASRCKGGLARRRKIVGHPPLPGRAVCRIDRPLRRPWARSSPTKESGAIRHDMRPSAADDPLLPIRVTPPAP